MMMTESECRCFAKTDFLAVRFLREQAAPLAPAVVSEAVPELELAYQVQRLAAQPLAAAAFYEGIDGRQHSLAGAAVPIGMYPPGVVLYGLPQLRRRPQCLFYCRGQLL